MTRDKWLNLLDTIEEKYEIESNEKQQLENDVPGEKEVVIFNASGLGRIKLEWGMRAKFLGEKTLFSDRIGSDVTVSKVYDDDDMLPFFNAYKWDGEDWQQIEGNLFANN